MLSSGLPEAGAVTQVPFPKCWIEKGLRCASIGGKARSSAFVNQVIVCWKLTKNSLEVTKESYKLLSY